MTKLIDEFRHGWQGISQPSLPLNSSLSALADITADEIKIDRSFITDIHKRPRSQGILRAIELLSEALGMTVIAEGIELFKELTYPGRPPPKSAMRRATTFPGRFSWRN